MHKGVGISVRAPFVVFAGGNLHFLQKMPAWFFTLCYSTFLHGMI